ncbi:MAG: iron uptake transporter permease EfeU [Actinomycetota bacterium]
MLATLVIGLREGLEAALIVGILAAFLRRNGRSLRAMWIGVILAIVLSVAVGSILELVSLSLPQAQQEGLETVIGAVAVVFVTGMIVWMNTHASRLKRDLEAEATAALGEGTAIALAVMAFLAVLKEGFETSVFLLATFQSSTSVIAAIAGAVIGILVAVGIGVGIYHGGVRINLGRFFRITGVFLIFVAAGLVLSALRTAHEAGWLNIGQQRTVDLSWLAPNGSIQSALITGVLGMPADPRLVEVLGWGIYLVSVLLYVFWPARVRPSGVAAIKTRLGIAGGLALIAAVLGLAVPLGPGVDGDSALPLSSGSGAVAGSVETTAAPDRFIITSDGTTSTVTASHSTSAVKDGVTAIERLLPSMRATTTSSVTLDQLATLNGGRLPIGMSLQQSPGPFTVTTVTSSTVRVWTVGAGILDAQSNTSRILQISGGGLNGNRTVSTAGTTLSGDSGAVATISARVTAAQSAVQELLLWKLWLPVALVIAALALALSAARAARRLEPSGLGAAASSQKTRNTAHVPQ